MIQIELAEKSDFPSLINIWAAAFHDTEKDIRLFLDFFYIPGSAILLRENGKPAAAAHLISGSSIIGFPEHASISCAYLYAVGVLPAFRGKGYGAAVSRCAAERSRILGADLCATAPADPGLFDFYEKKAGFTPAFYADIINFRTAGKMRRYSVEPISPGQYSGAREQMLAGWPHLRCAPRWADYFAVTCRERGGLFEIRDWLSGETAFAAVELNASQVILKELLCRRGAENFLEAAAIFFRRRFVTARLPGQGPPFAMASVPLPSPAYWGLAFD
jgi:ribosomal protein S18 acetylase RimI-like enzyme